MIASKFNFFKLIVLSVCISIQANAQQVVQKDQSQDIANNNLTEFDFKRVREVMKKDGASDEGIDKWITQRKLLFLKEKNTDQKNSHVDQSQPPVVYANSCGDMGGENGWSNWKGRAGTIDLFGGVTWGAWSNPPPASNTNTAFTITTGAANDGCTPAAGNPALPIVAPGFGNFSIMLGVAVTPNAFCEQISFPLTVAANDTNFIYTYAIVLDNPADGNHVGIMAPHAEIYILDGKDTVPCSHQLYFGSNDNTLPAGFFQTNCNNGFANAYKPWTTVGVNLNKYLGKTLNVIVGNYDCALGGHFCHSYWDFACPPVSNSVTPFCLGQASTMTGPVSALVSNQYKYQWYINTKPYNPLKHWTIIPGATGVTYSTIPQVGDTFALEVIQTSKCNFWMPFVPQIKMITADFTLTNNCGTVTVTDVSPPPNTGTITNWNWSFPGGNPATSTNQTQVVTYATGGTHTITLSIISSEGCVATKTLTITTGNPIANFSTGPVCLGVTTLFSDSSAGATGDPLNVWAWDFGDGATSTVQNPSHVYPAAGTYTVTLTVTTKAGCTTTITHPVTVYPFPVPAFTTGPVCFNNKTVFTNQSTGGTQYAWDFGDGNTSTLVSPTHTYGAPGTYTVTLTVTTASGCKAMVPLTTVVNPLPVASFTSLPVCLGNPTCFKDGSSVSPGTVSGWSWNFGDPGSGAANTSSLQNPCHTYNGPGPFTVVLTATSDSGCQNTIMLPANTNPEPTAGIITRNVCVGLSTTLTDASTSPAGTGNAINSWVWNFGDGTPTVAQQNPSHLYTTAGTYTITLIVTTVNGCKDTTTNTVTIYNPPVANFSQPARGCSPVTANYTDLSTSLDGTVSNWQWSFPGGTPQSSSVQNPTNIVYSAIGAYSVSLIVTTTHGCIDSIQLPMVEVYPWPKSGFGVAPTIAPTVTPIFNFSDAWTQDVVKWQWDFGDGSPLDTLNTDPVHSYSATANNNDFYKYNICIKVWNQYGCWATNCHDVELIPEFTFYIPNTFTPNGDGTNEMFFGKCRGVKEYDIWLFDRWGNQVWDCHKDDKNTNWDSDATNPRQEGLASSCKWDGVVVQGGMDMGGNSRQLAQEDVYVWKVHLLDIFNKRHSYIGHVNIVR